MHIYFSSSLLIVVLVLVLSVLPSKFWGTDDPVSSVFIGQALDQHISSKERAVRQQKTIKDAALLTSAETEVTSSVEGA